MRIKRSFALGLLAFGGLLMALPVSAAKAPSFDLRQDVLAVQHDGLDLLISLKSPKFAFNNDAASALKSSRPDGGSTSPLSVAGDISSGKQLELAYAPISVEGIGKLEIKQHLQWFPKESVIRKWAAYRLTDSKSTPVLAEITLDVLDASSYLGNIIPDQFQSYPAFFKGYFAGVEFPVAQTVLQGKYVVISHRPGLKMTPGVWYETRKAVYGIAPVGQEKQAFLKYVEANRPRPNNLRIAYNCWWSTEGPAGLAATESESLRLMNDFDKNLFKPYGVKFDSFIIDMGWADTTKGIWEINKDYFPNGFTKLKEAANKVGMSTGIWVSPCYGYGILNPNWPGIKDYETFDVPHWDDATKTDKYACLAGPNYRKRFTELLVDLVKNSGVRHIKFDGYRFTCPSADHGHEPGDASAEAVAQGFIDVMSAVREASPDVWLEPTCFAPHASPWWSFHCTSVIGFYGDDMPYGRVPCPTYQESYTTARDFWNLQGASLLEYPIAAQEVMGMNHQNPDPFMNDGVVTVLRGNMFLPLYLNPKYMDESQWRMLAGLITWARNNQSTLRETQPVLPASWQGGKLPRYDYNAPMPREPYGFAHWKDGKGIIMLRNPWVLPQKITLKLDESLGMTRGAKWLDAVSLYPENRVYGKGLKYGETLEVPLAPYETVVISLAALEDFSNLPPVTGVIGNQIKSEVSTSVVRPGYHDNRPGYQLKLDSKVNVKSLQAKLLILLEGGKAVPASPTAVIKINGKDVVAKEKFTLESWAEAEKYRDMAFAASSLPPAERWRFLEVPLKSGDNDISINMSMGTDWVKLSAYVWAMQPGGGLLSFPNSLPQPEVVSLDGACLLQPVEMSGVK